MSLFIVTDTETLWVVAARSWRDAKRFVRYANPLAGKLTATRITEPKILLSVPLALKDR